MLHRVLSLSVVLRRLRSQLALAPVVLATLLAASSAQAGDVNICVLPFEGEGSGGFPLAEAVEFEMEVLDGVVVQGSRGPSRAWFKAVKKRKGKRMRNKDRRKIMKKFGLDALVTGEAGVDEDGDPALHVVAYGKDGKARFYEVFPPPESIDQAAAGIVRSMSSMLKSWASQPSIKVRIPEPKADKPEMRDDDDILVGSADGERKKRKKKKKKKNKRDRDAGDDVDELFVDGDDFDGDRDKRKKKKKKKKKRKFADVDDDDKRRALSGNSSRRSVEGKKKRNKKRRSNQPGFFSLLRDKDPLVPFAKVSLDVHGAGWWYIFNGQNPDQSYFRVASLTPHPTGVVNVELWPVEWIGLVADGRVGFVPFLLKDGTGRITPVEFFHLHLGGAAAVRARYLHRLSLGKKVGQLGIGGGVRAGYRYFGSTIDPQTIDGTPLTIIPGFNSHALMIGPELFIPFRVYGFPGEVQATVEVNPSISLYEELPDAPGQQVQAFGWFARLAARGGLPMGIFVEASVESNGVYAIYNGTGRRVRLAADANTGAYENLTGGDVINLNVTMGVGAGFHF